MSATGADIRSRYSTRVVIATVPNARPPLAPSGSPTGRRSCCPFLTSTSPSLFHSRSVAWHFRTQDRSIPSCFRLLRKLCSGEDLVDVRNDLAQLRGRKRHAGLLLELRDGLRIHFDEGIIEWRSTIRIQPE